MRRAVAILAAIALAACDQAAEETARHRSPAGPVPPTEQRAGDPEAGRVALLNAPYVSCGVPYDAWARMSPAADPADLIPGREGRNAELPYAFTAHVNADGVEVVSSNCLTCHAERLEGELVIGLGAAFADFTQDPRRFATAAGAWVRGEAETAAWKRWADRIEGIAPYIRTRTIGVNPATNLTWALMAHRDPETMAWSQTPLIEPPQTDPIPVKVPPWWGMARKHAMFHTTIGRGDHARFMLLASTLCADTLEEVAAVDAYAPDVRAYIASLKPPRYPWPVDAALAAEGRTVFGDRCARCHGTYGDNAFYPNEVYPLEVVGTDPEYAMAATDGRRDRFYAWVGRSPFGEGVTPAPARGYIALPLDGVWATAPYLHNGSVPDMRALLDTRLRPRFWRHAQPRAYDPEALGWRHERLEAGQDAATSAAERARIYDTTLLGYGAGGHDYGDVLTDAERAALMEYLKTL